jgi:putative transposase
MSYTNLLYHIVYATKERAPLITKTLRPRLHEYLGGTVRGLGGVALEVSGTADHVHILARLGPTISVSEFLSKLKSGSSVGPSYRTPEDLLGRRDSRLSLSASRK